MFLKHYDYAIILNIKSLKRGTEGGSKNLQESFFLRLCKCNLWFFLVVECFTYMILVIWVSEI